MKMFTRTRDRAGTSEFEATLAVIHARILVRDGERHRRSRWRDVLVRLRQLAS